MGSGSRSGLPVCGSCREQGEDEGREREEGQAASEAGTLDVGESAEDQRARYQRQVAERGRHEEKGPRPGKRSIRRSMSFRWWLVRPDGGCTEDQPHQRWSESSTDDQQQCGQADECPRPTSVPRTTMDRAVAGFARSGSLSRPTGPVAGVDLTTPPLRRARGPSHEPGPARRPGAQPSIAPRFSPNRFQRVMLSAGRRCATPQLPVGTPRGRRVATSYRSGMPQTSRTSSS